jgi:hypothetical protein
MNNERRRRVKKQAEEKWKEEWLHYREDNWMRRLINNPCILKGKKYNIDHYTMQISCRHGIFNSYRKVINTESHLRC